MTIIYFILILGIIILIHEFGHFIFAKKAGIYVYEFSLGMGPQIFKWHRKNDETEYSIRLFPIGGYVSMAGEEIEVDDTIPKEKRMQSKTWMQRFLVVTAGVMMNFLLALVLLFIIGCVNGTPVNKPIINDVNVEYPFYNSGIEKNDIITKVNGKNTKTQDMFLLEYQIALTGEEVTFTVLKENGNIVDYKIKPLKLEDEEGVYYSFGFSMGGVEDTSPIRHIKYAFNKFGSLINQMFHTIIYLCTGKLSLNNLSGPIGIYSVVGEAAKLGFINIIYLIALLSINVGFINILPFPAFDGGRLFFMIIEKIRRKPINPKVENTINSIGLILLLILMAVISFNDIVKLFR